MASSKRRADDVDVDATDAPAKSQPKRQRKQNHKQKNADATHGGQRGFFGDLDQPTVPKDDDDLECEDDGDALSYLKSVRLQADEIPHVLAAPRAGPQLPALGDESQDVPTGRDVYTDGVGDFRGYYEDGAYVAYPDSYLTREDNGNDWAPEDDLDVRHQGEGLDAEHEEEASPQSSHDGPRNSSSAEIHEAYYRAVASQYTALRARLQTTPPDDVVSALSESSHPTEVEAFSASNKAFLQWSRRLSHSDPLPAQIASMHKDSVIRLLRVMLGGRLLKKTKSHETVMTERTSRWLWALLARLPEQGELGYQEVGWVRELGKRAVLFMVSMAESDILHDQFGVSGGGDGGEEGVEEGQDEEEREGEYEHEELSGQDDLPKEKSNAHLEEEEDVEMELDSDNEAETSEKPRLDSSTLATTVRDVEAAKSRLLAQLAAGTEVDDINGDDDDDDFTELSMTAAPAHASQEPSPFRPIDDGDFEDESDEGGDDDNDDRTKVNMRVTLNMILTVAGEFYGQRDLLEFRDPFGRSFIG